MVSKAYTDSYEIQNYYFAAESSFASIAEHQLEKNTENFFGLFIQNICLSARLSTIICIVLRQVVVGQFLILSSCCNLLS